MPAARIGHLFVLKVLAGQHQDLTDLGYLISATGVDLSEARASVALMVEVDRPDLSDPFESARVSASWMHDTLEGSTTTS